MEPETRTYEPETDQDETNPELDQNRYLVESARGYVDVLSALAERGTLEDLTPDEFPDEVSTLVDDNCGTFIDPETDDELDPEDATRRLEDGEDIGISWHNPETDLIDLLNEWAIEVYGSATVRAGGDIDLDTVTIVWGTGGPHYETIIDPNGRARHIAYGWFRGNEVDGVSYGHDSLYDILAEWFEVDR